MQRYMIMAPSHLPMMISQSRMGEVISSSMVPVRFSSANRRIEMSGIRKRPTTLALPSNGAITYSLTLMGWFCPPIWQRMPAITKKAVAL